MLRNFWWNGSGKACKSDTCGQILVPPFVNILIHLTTGPTNPLYTPRPWKYFFLSKQIWGREIEISVELKKRVMIEKSLFSSFSTEPSKQRIKTRPERKKMSKELFWCWQAAILLLVLLRFALIFAPGANPMKLKFLMKF